MACHNHTCGVFFNDRPDFLFHEKYRRRKISVFRKKGVEKWVLKNIYSTVCVPNTWQNISMSSVMMMLLLLMNCFCGMVDQRKAFSLISIGNHCQRSSLSRISDTPQAGFEAAQFLSSGLAEWRCAVVITTTSWRHEIVS